MRRLLITVEYDGSAFAGWQWQKDQPTIQGAIERAILETTGEVVRVIGAGRTDAGVHARGQCAHFDTTCAIPTQRFPLALTSRLPKEIAVWRACEVPGTFHACRSVKGKIYRYTIYNGPIRAPLYAKTAMHIAEKLDIMRMRQAVEILLGEYDFSAFVTGLSERKKKAPQARNVRRIFKLQIDQDGCLVQIEVGGTGFLYNMVRTMVGTLVEVGRGKQEPDWVGEVLASGDRRRAGPVVSPHGLCLMEVLYGREDVS